MLVNFDSPGICLHDGGSICLVPRMRSTGSYGPGVRFIGPPDSFRGIESHVTPEVICNGRKSWVAVLHQSSCSVETRLLCDIMDQRVPF